MYDLKLNWASFCYCYYFSCFPPQMPHGAATAKPLHQSTQRLPRLLKKKILQSNWPRLTPQNTQTWLRSLACVATPPSNSSEMERKPNTPVRQKCKKGGKGNFLTNTEILQHFKKKF